MAPKSSLRGRAVLWYVVGIASVVALGAAGFVVAANARRAWRPEPPVKLSRLTEEQEWSRFRATMVRRLALAQRRTNLLRRQAIDRGGTGGTADSLFFLIDSVSHETGVMVAGLDTVAATNRPAARAEVRRRYDLLKALIREAGELVVKDEGSLFDDDSLDAELEELLER